MWFKNLISTTENTMEITKEQGGFYKQTLPKPELTNDKPVFSFPGIIYYFRSKDYRKGLKNSPYAS
jgi:hypothetical protein